MERKILVTGDYWHRDFKQFLAGFDTVTLMPIDTVISNTDTKFDLVVIAQSRPNQYSLDAIERLQQQLPNTPFVSVSGSWCEGELRTGQPWPGVLRVYWHQWQGRFEAFTRQLETEGITNWHAPKTSSVADRILHRHHRFSSNNQIQCVGISAWTQTQFEMVKDAVQQFGWECRWVERCTWDADSSQLLNPICIEADSLSVALDRRTDWLQSEFPHAALVLILNFPRANEVESLLEKGIFQVVSKPFELNDLKVAIERAFQEKVLTSQNGITQSGST